ncbi:MAG: hypothetical protein R2698_13440 [Microthrixaceae bacterium]
MSAALRDGSVLWLWGDTAARHDDGSLAYFTIGTASWSEAGTPLVSRDTAGPDGAAPGPFAVPDSVRCPHTHQRAGTWPTAAVVQPVGPRDRVVAWLAVVCFGEGDRRATDMGMGVAEWWYDPADPPRGRSIVATWLNQRLFPAATFGSAAATTPDGRIVTEWCERPEDPTDTDGFGPCAAATTTFDRVADPTSYVDADGRAVTASTVGARHSVGTPFRLEGGAATPYPPGPFSIAFEPHLDAWVMVTSPWPGQVPFVAVRIAERPEGPWSGPLTVRLPGCSDRRGELHLGCYAANVQPRFSEPGRLGIGWYDTAVELFPIRGAFKVATIPYS